MKRSLVALVPLVLAATACTSAGVDVTGTARPDSAPTTGGWSTGTTDPGGGPIGFAPAALRRFDDCSTFLDHVRREAAERVGPYGFDAGYWGPVDRFVVDDQVFGDQVFAESAADAPAATIAASAIDVAAAAPDAGGATSADGDAVSGTNVQVAGVDEPDIVKTDGDRILAVAAGVLHYVSVDPDGSTGTWRGSVDLDGDDGARYGHGHEIFVVGDRAFVFAQGETYWHGGWEGDVVPVPVPHREFGPRLLIHEVDLAQPSALRIVSTMVVEGRYVSARATGTTARVVVTSPPANLGFVYPSQPGSEDVAEQTNREIVLRSTLDDWVPTYTLDQADVGSSSGLVADCARLHTPSDFSGFDMLSILTVDLAAGLAAPAGTSSVLASGETVYASQDRMYVSTNVWSQMPFGVPELDGPEFDRPAFEESYETAIHRFSIAGSGPAEYEASGAVAGHLLNQFSMHDRDGVLYVATTKGAPWSESSESQIVALEIDGDRLEPVGVVGGLGRGERIYSVRYVDDVAYLVTFRQIDPFYVVDLADPRAMRVAGELKIPGYSSYLHPVGDDLVLGVGQDATLDGRVTGAKLSLFDVRDPANPVELDVWTMPHSSSSVEFDHRAFLYWAPTNTAVLPMQSYGANFAGAIVFSVTADGIVERGRITHADDGDGPVGRTDCDVLGTDAFGEDSELFWIGQDGGQVQLCGADDRGGATGLFCEPIPVDDLPYWGEISDVDLTGVDRIELCWPEWHGYQVAIERTMVIDGSLWTLSHERLQANDLGTLDRSAVVTL